MAEGNVRKADGDILFAKDVNQINNLYGVNLVQNFLEEHANSVGMNKLTTFTTGSNMVQVAGSAFTGMAFDNESIFASGVIDEFADASLNTALWHAFPAGGAVNEGNGYMNILTGGQETVKVTSSGGNIFDIHGNHIRFSLGSIKMTKPDGGGTFTIFRINFNGIGIVGGSTPFTDVSGGEVDLMRIGGNAFTREKLASDSDFGAWFAIGNSNGSISFEVEKTDATGGFGSLLVSWSRFLSGTLPQATSYDGIAISAPLDGGNPGNALFYLNGAGSALKSGLDSTVALDGGTFQGINLGSWTTITSTGVDGEFRYIGSHEFGSGLDGGIIISNIGLATV